MAIRSRVKIMINQPVQIDGLKWNSKITTLLKTRLQQSLRLYINSEIYNSIINTVVNYQSNFRFSPDPKIQIFTSTENWSFYEFFKEFRKALILFGIVVLRKVGKNMYEYISPLIINYTKPFELNDEGNISAINTDAGKIILNEDIIIFANNPIPGVNIFMPEFHYIFDEIEKVEKLKSSILTKRTIISNIALMLKMEAPEQGIYFGKTAEEIEQLQQLVRQQVSVSTIKEGSIIATMPDSKLDVVNPIDSNYDEHYIYKRLCEIAAAVNIPAFLITGDLKELNYAAARGALQDFIVYSNREITRLAYMVMRKFGFSARITLPPPTTISVAESIKYFEFMNELTKDERYNFDVFEIKDKLKLGGLL